MPKVVDHDERRTEIIAATMRVIGRVGLTETTVREIAKEAGYSNGVLAHYFTNKQQILVMAHLAAFEIATGRINSQTGGVFTLEALRTAILEALPLDEQRRLEAHIDVSFWAYALLDPELQRVRTQSHVESIAFWQEKAASTREAGHIHTSATDNEIATDIMVLIDGLSAEALLHPEIVTPERQIEYVDRFLARISGDQSSD